MKYWTLGFLALAVACGGSSKPAVAPEEEPMEEEPLQDPKIGHSVDTEIEMPETVEVEAKEEEEEGEEKPAVAEPEFTDGMSVEEARKAIPQGTERLNLDPDTLSQPFQNPDVFKACKLGGQKFKVRVAVWDGRAVGVDVITKNKKLQACIGTEIRKLEWKDKVKSLNTIDFVY